jgi:hypothetical protein
MAVRKFSGRYAGFLVGRAAARTVPAWRARMPFFDRVLALPDAGTAEEIVETQSLTLSAEERAFATRLRDPVPETIRRQIALVALDNVTLFGNTGVIVDEAKGALLRQRGGREFVTYHDFKAMPTTAVKKPAGNYFNMLGSYKGHEHFFHFLFDRLPKLHYLLARFALGRENVTVLTNEKPPPFQRDIYRFVAEQHPNIRFEPVPQRERWILPRLYHLDDFQPIKRTLASPDALAFMRRLVFAGYGIDAGAPTPRLYVTRSDTRKRRITNENELMPLLARHGFEFVAPGRLPLKEQADLFASAEAIVGPHGAGLTNILFAPPSARVIEIFPAGKVKNTYFLLAKSLGQTYRGIVGSAMGRHESFSVAARQVEEALSVLGPADAH